MTRPSLLFERKIAFEFLNEVFLGRKLLQKVMKQLLRLVVCKGCCSETRRRQLQ
jgi:hypothetical protein